VHSDWDDSGDLLFSEDIEWEGRGGGVGRAPPAGEEEGGGGAEEGGCGGFGEVGEVGGELEVVEFGVDGIDADGEIERAGEGGASYGVVEEGLIRGIGDGVLDGCGGEAVQAEGVELVEGDSGAGGPAPMPVEPEK